MTNYKHVCMITFGALMMIALDDRRFVALHAAGVQPNRQKLWDLAHAISDKVYPGDSVITEAWIEAYRSALPAVISGGALIYSQIGKPFSVDDVVGDTLTNVRFLLEQM